MYGFTYHCLVQPTDSHVVVGMSSKLLSIKFRPVKEELVEMSASPVPPKGGSYRYFMRGKTYQPTEVCAKHYP